MDSGVQFSMVYLEVLFAAHLCASVGRRNIANRTANTFRSVDPSAGFHQVRSSGRRIQSPAANLGNGDSYGLTHQIRAAQQVVDPAYWRKAEIIRLHWQLCREPQELPAVIVADRCVGTQVEKSAVADLKRVAPPERFDPCQQYLTV